jgi:hypothetical protein
MRRLSILCLFLCSSLAWADHWDFRLGVASYPEQNTLIGVEFTRVFDLTETIDLGVGGALRTDFSQTIGPAALGRLRIWLMENIAVGASTELGYMFHQGFSNPNSYTYFLVGPLLAVRLIPIFAQWEPGEIFYQGTSQFLPLRFAFGIVF